MMSSMTSLVDRKLCRVVATICFLSAVAGFNVDLRTASVREGEAGSMFGFVVAQHVDRGQNWILVGAPNAQTTQPDIERAGAVYRCRTDSSPCQLVPFDTQGDNREWNRTHMVAVENKSLQWFGASLDASTTTSTAVVVACAPRYVFLSRAVDRHDPIGSCIVSRTEPDAVTAVYHRYSPCKKGRTGFDQLGHCQYGFSVALNQDNTYMTAGAVGSYFWQGKVISQDLNDNREFFETIEGPSTQDNTFMGYAITVGHFTNDTLQDYAVGIPKGGNLCGMVLILSDQLTPLHNISGEQTGEYFGSAIAAGDFNGDGLDDIAVGAPLYSHSSTEGFDIGRVYVFYQTPDREFRSEPTRLSGSRRSRSRFGFALASLEDINVDGIRDLIVGSPYDGPNGRGTVYIYNGSPDGIRPTPSQTCQAADIDTHLSTFGYSLSAGTDMDDNGYPDILVGAYESDRVVYLRSKPIIRVTAKLRTDPEFIDIESTTCLLRDRSNATCFGIAYCLSYAGHGVPNDIELSLALRLDSEKAHSHRAFFLSGPSQNDFVKNETIKLRKKQEKCKTLMAYVKNNIRDKLRPIAIQLNYTLSKPTAQPGSNELESILDHYIPATVNAHGHIQKRCGQKRFCIPDLVVQANSPVKTYTLGSTTEVDVQIVVINRGEDAFEAVVRLNIPAELEYINAYSTESSNKIDKLCVQQDEGAEGEIVCDIGNPLPAHQKVVFTVRTSASKATGMEPTLLFHINATSTNEENSTTMEDNVAIVSIPINAVVNITLVGVSHPENILVNDTWSSSFDNESDIGPEVTHLYELTNYGPSRVASMRTFIRWPMSLSDGSYLLYLLETPQVVRGEGQCWADNVNPHNVSIENRKMGKSDLEQLAVTAKLRTRAVRQTAEQLIGQMNCGEDMPGCTIIRCDTGSMGGRDDSVLIQIRSRVYTNTLIRKQKEFSGFRARSIASTNVLSLPYNVRYVVTAIKNYEVETFVAVIGVGPDVYQVEFWVIALSIIGGCVLLFLIVIILWKCGFFERKKPEDHPPMYQAVKTEET